MTFLKKNKEFRKKFYASDEAENIQESNFTEGDTDGNRNGAFILKRNDGK